MAEIEWTPVRIKSVIDDPFRVFAIFVLVVLSVITVINAE
ncbi:hypothetical protein SAMN05443529_107132 [Desulfosporosinus hippei DSM 8344]|uniref:Uncharacterized protein n=1 Tax=Desulfosporosinus hippei DSM 8344 TaxID=1121419 RepID=A0A1G7XX53_9FIRM|nr:hypothetical protein SAMN05443529_107132 [Desulfosporosinus hippei DSM 8344]